MVVIVITAQMLDYNDMNRIQSNTQWLWNIVHTARGPSKLLSLLSVL